MEEDFDITELNERDYFFPLYYGERGVKWLLQDSEINTTNPLFFTCSFCRKTSHGDEKPHEAKCRNELLNKLGM